MEQAHFSYAALKGTFAAECTRDHALQKRRELEIFFCCSLFGVPRAMTG
jgi:hypothetical protein